MFAIKLSHPDHDPLAIDTSVMKKIFAPHVRRKFREMCVPFLQDAAATKLSIKNYRNEWIVVDRTTLEDFSAWLAKFMVNVLERSPVTVIEQIEASVSEAQFIPPSAVEKIMDMKFHYRSTVADLYFKHDLDGVGALLLFRKQKGKALNIKLSENQFPSARRITGGWFAFATSEEAVMAKMSVAHESQIFEL